MASVASPVARGVPPIRAGKGHSFLLRRLHSLSGIVPIGAFLLEHFISNAFATNGPLLAFNGRHKGRLAVFAQVASGAPLPLTYVIVFEVKKTKGTFGTSLIGTLPPIASEYGYISAFDLSLSRTYTYRGRAWRLRDRSRAR